MAIASLTRTAAAFTTSTSTLPVPTEPPRGAPASDGIGTDAIQLAEAIADGVGATVSFSGQALQALEHAGEAAFDGARTLAGGAWQALQHAASGVEHVGEAVAETAAGGAAEVAEAAKAAAKELGHYAAVGLQAASDAVSDFASGSVMAAAAACRALPELI